MDDLNWSSEEMIENDENAGFRMTPEEAREKFLEMFNKFNKDQRKAFRRLGRAAQDPNCDERCYFLDVSCVRLNLR